MLKSLEKSGSLKRGTEINRFLNELTAEFVHSLMALTFLESVATLFCGDGKAKEKNLSAA